MCGWPQEGGGQPIDIDAVEALSWSKEMLAVSMSELVNLRALATEALFDPKLDILKSGTNEVLAYPNLGTLNTSIRGVVNGIKDITQRSEGKRTRKNDILHSRGK